MTVDNRSREFSPMLFKLGWGICPMVAVKREADSTSPSTMEI